MFCFVFFILQMILRCLPSFPCLKSVFLELWACNYISFNLCKGIELHWRSRENSSKTADVSFCEEKKINNKKLKWMLFLGRLSCAFSFCFSLCHLYCSKFIVIPEFSFALVLSCAFFLFGFEVLLNCWILKCGGRNGFRRSIVCFYFDLDCILLLAKLPLLFMQI